MDINNINRKTNSDEKFENKTNMFLLTIKVQNQSKHMLVCVEKKL